MHRAGPPGPVSPAEGPAEPAWRLAPRTVRSTSVVRSTRPPRARPGTSRSHPSRSSRTSLPASVIDSAHCTSAFLGHCADRADVAAVVADQPGVAARHLGLDEAVPRPVAEGRGSCRARGHNRVRLEAPTAAGLGRVRAVPMPPPGRRSRRQETRCTSSIGPGPPPTQRAEPERLPAAPGTAVPSPRASKNTRRNVASVSAMRLKATCGPHKRQQGRCRGPGAAAETPDTQAMPTPGSRSRPPPARPAPPPCRVVPRIRYETPTSVGNTGGA